MILHFVSYILLKYFEGPKVYLWFTIKVTTFITYSSFHLLEWHTLSQARLLICMCNFIFYKNICINLIYKQCN